MNQQEVLSRPFNIETHKQTFINYLEVVILEDGVVEYAVPSHQEKLIALACKKHSVARGELADMCPPEYYFDYVKWLSMMSGAIPVWNFGIDGEPNEKQREVLKELKIEGLYGG